jgi:hypothetical protein
VVAKVEFYARELFPRGGFIVTNLEAPSRAVMRLYNQLGTAEAAGTIKAGKQAVKMPRLSYHRQRERRSRATSVIHRYADVKMRRAGRRVSGEERGRSR